MAVSPVRSRPDRTGSGTVIVDCDIHNSVPPGGLEPYLPARWRRHLTEYGSRIAHGLASGYVYPKGAADAARHDAWPPEGGPPGSSLPFMRAQLLDPLGIGIGILNCLHRAGQELNLDLASAEAAAVNDWQVARWLDPEPRLRASIVVNWEDPEAAAAEIERASELHPGFVQVLLLARTREPLGRRRYWPIYQAAERFGLPVGIHFGGIGGHPVTGSGWPSFYLEDHTAMAQAFQSQLTSLVFEGVLARFPDLRFVLIEGGVAWLPSLLWRMDRLWRRLGSEVPHVVKPPSEYVRESFRLTTQPIEEPGRARDFATVVEQLGDRRMLMFATDYPHWDFDDPSVAQLRALPAATRELIMGGNARALYRF